MASRERQLKSLRRASWRAAKAWRGLRALEALLAPSSETQAKQQARVRQALDAIAARVPVERRVPSLPSIAVPVIARLKYTEDDNPAKVMYINLLTRSVDREKHADVHPGVYHGD